MQLTRFFVLSAILAVLLVLLSITLQVFNAVDIFFYWAVLQPLLLSLTWGKKLP